MSLWSILAFQDASVKINIVKLKSKVQEQNRSKFCSFAVDFTEVVDIILKQCIIYKE